MTPYYAELFAGAGGMSMGLEAAGFVPFAHAEIEPNARAVLRKHWPTVRLDGDVTQLNGADYTGITLLSGGSPCQDLSVAGKRAGLDGSRSSLFYEQVRIWNESGAPYFLWENVYGALSSNGGKDFAAVLSAIVGANVNVPLVRGKPKWQRAGRAVGPTAVAEWRVLDLQYVAGRHTTAPPQRRVRVFVLASRADTPGAQQNVLIETGVCRHFAKGENPRQNASSGSGGSTGSCGVVLGIDQELNCATEMMGTLNTGSKTGGGQYARVVAFHPTQTPVSGDVSPARGRESGGMGVYARMVAFGEYAVDGTASTIKARDGKDATDLVVSGIDERSVVGTLDFGGHGGSYNGQDAYQQRQEAAAGRPRRLTPRECERLMAWPDDHTRYGVREDGTEYALSDTARYRLCGNGVGSTCAEWIGSRLMDSIAQGDTL